MAASMRAVAEDSEVTAPVRPRTSRLAGGRSLTSAVRVGRRTQRLTSAELPRARQPPTASMSVTGV